MYLQCAHAEHHSKKFAILSFCNFLECFLPFCLLSCKFIRLSFLSRLRLVTTRRARTIISPKLPENPIEDGYSYSCTIKYFDRKTCHLITEHILSESRMKAFCKLLTRLLTSLAKTVRTLHLLLAVIVPKILLPS
jgi:hypothetical protein